MNNTASNPSYRPERPRASLAWLAGASLICGCVSASHGGASAVEEAPGDLVHSADRPAIDRAMQLLESDLQNNDGGMQILLEAMGDARQSQDWDTLEMLAWYGHQQSMSGPTELSLRDSGDHAGNHPEIISGLRLSLRFLFSAAQAGSLRSMSPDHAVRPFDQEPSDCSLRDAIDIRRLATDTADALVQAGDFGNSDVVTVLRTLHQTRLVAMSCSDFGHTAAWEELDGDLAATFLARGFELPRDLLPDDHYFRAASAAIRFGRGPHEVERLLRKIDDLSGRRENSCFHASNLFDELERNDTPAFESYTFARDWLLLHPEEPCASLINRVVAGAYRAARESSTAEIREMIGLLDAIQDVYAELLANEDSVLAEARVDQLQRLGQTRPLHQWERRRHSSEIASTLTSLIGQIHDATFVDQANSFLNTYPMHPNAASIRAMLDRFHEEVLPPSSDLP